MPATPFNWTCPYCGQAATITSVNYHGQSLTVDVTEKEDTDYTIRHSAITCPNPECGELTLECVLFKNGWKPGPMGKLWTAIEQIETWKLMPRSIAKPVPNYVPEEIRNNYREACLILNDSPKASAAMSRRCLQGMVRDFWNIPAAKRGNLGAELSYIKSNVDSDTFESIQAIRAVGDIGAHMEKAVDTIVDVEPEEAELLVGLIEMLLSDWYISRHRRTQRNDKLQKIVGQKRTAKKVSKKSLDKLESSNGNQ